MMKVSFVGKNSILALLCAVTLIAAPALGQERADSTYEASGVLALAPSVPTAIVFDPDGETILVATTQVNPSGQHSGGFEISRWNVSDQRRLSSIYAAQTGYVRNLRLDKNGSLLLVATETEITVLDAESGTLVRRLPLPSKAYVADVKFSADGRRIAAALSNRLIVWDTESGTELFSKGIAGLSVTAESVAISPDGAIAINSGNFWHTTLFSEGGYVYGIAQVWNVDSGSRQREIKLKGRFSSADFSPDSSRFVTANGYANTVSVWEVATGRQVLSLNGHTDAVGNAWFSQDGKHILTSGNDETTRIWDAQSGKSIAVLTHKATPLSAFSTQRSYFILRSRLSADGNRVAAIALDGTVRIWEDAAIKRDRETEVFSAELASAQSGDAAAMARLSALYRSGTGTPRDTRQADDWLSRAAAVGDLSARTQLAAILMSGDGSRQDCQAAGRELRAVLAARPGGDAAVVMDTILAPLGGASAASALSPQIQADLLETQAIDALRQKEYPAFLQNLCALEALDHIERLMPEERNELLFHRAVGLRAAGKPVAALSALNEYLNTAGNTGPSYTEALQLLRPLQDEAK